MPDLYTYPVPRQKAKTLRAPLPPAARKPIEQMGLINGRVPDSIEEWRVAVALWKYKIDFQFQVVVRGGGGLRGTIRLDFLCFTPLALPVPVYGEQWHKGQRKAEDILQEAFLMKQFHRAPVPLFGAELQDQEMANQTVLAKIVKGG